MRPVPAARPVCNQLALGQAAFSFGFKANPGKPVTPGFGLGGQEHRSCGACKSKTLIVSLGAAVWLG